MNSFGCIAASLLAIQIILLLLVMNIQYKCENKDKMGVPVTTSPKIKPKIEPKIEPKRELMNDRLKSGLNDNNLLSLSLDDDKYKSEYDTEISRIPVDNMTNVSGSDYKKYRERLQQTHVEHMDKYPTLDPNEKPDHRSDPNVDNEATKFILSEPRTNMRY
jgi:hypothetical protein